MAISLRPRSHAPVVPACYRHRRPVKQLFERPGPQPLPGLRSSLRSRYFPVLIPGPQALQRAGHLPHDFLIRLPEEQPQGDHVPDHHMRGQQPVLASPASRSPRESPRSDPGKRRGQHAQRDVVSQTAAQRLRRSSHRRNLPVPGTSAQAPSLTCARSLT